MSEKGLARSAGPQAGPKTKLRIKRNKGASAQPSGCPVSQNRSIASAWVSKINKRIFAELLPPPTSWARVCPSPPVKAENGNNVAPPDADENAVIPDVSASRNPPLKRRKKCVVADAIPAAPSLDQQQIAALQLLNRKLREKLQDAEASNAALTQQVAEEKAHRESVHSKVVDMEEDVRVLRERLAAAEAKLQQQDGEAFEMKALHTAMTMRVGMGESPSAMLSSRDQYLEQRLTAERLIKTFDEACLRSDADDPGEQNFNGGAGAVLSGLQAAVLLIHSGAHEFQVGAEKNARNLITAGRGRIKEAEKWLASIGQLTNRLRDAAEASSATLDKNERTRRSIFTQGASVLVKRMHTLAEAEYLCCERISVNQTTKHANLKAAQQNNLRQLLKKQRSPESDVSCTDALVDPHIGTPTMSQVRELIDFSNHFNQARKRLEATVDIAIGCAREGPRLSADLHRYFKWVERVEDAELARKGRAIGWTMAAVAGEFGMGFNANVNTLQRACTMLRTMLQQPRSARA